jgi:hypothetical protein
MTRWQRRVLMRTFLYGVFFGAAAMYLYINHGAQVDSSITAMLAWRDSARGSVYGYGGNRQ